jgi:excisionase family DNA binding protein
MTSDPQHQKLALNVPEAARLLGIPRAHAYGLVARDELPHLRLGGRIIIPAAAIRQLLAGAKPNLRPAS